MTSGSVDAPCSCGDGYGDELSNGELQALPGVLLHVVLVGQHRAYQINPDHSHFHQGNTEKDVSRRNLVIVGKA